MELTDAQIAKLTPEQITAIEEDESRAEEILKGLATEEPEPEQAEEEDAANGEGEEDEEEEQDEEESEDEPEEKPVVLTKNGKKTIPYEKLQALRVENANLRERLTNLQRAQTDLEALRNQKATAKSPERRAELQAKLMERISRMKEDFPDVGESLESVNEIITEISDEIKADKAEMEKKAEEERIARTEAVNEQVRQAKEKFPDLLYWEAQDGDEWQEAMMQDQILISNPKWANKSYEERFAEVIKRVRTLMPDASEPPSSEPSAKVKEKAKAKIDKATAKKPTTLSDIQGGGNPASEKEQLENLSPHELAKRLMNMPARSAAAMRADLD